MEIRLACNQDVDAIMEIYAQAKVFMREQGNLHQWNSAYPERELIEEDIQKKQCYVCVHENEIVAVFAFILGEDPTYRVIEHGAWNQDVAYGTIHRIASNGKYKGVAKHCYDFCASKRNYLRADTHRDNHVMQHSLCAYGFRECGIIYLKDGSPRIAYDYQG